MRRLTIVRYLILLVILVGGIWFFTWFYGHGRLDVSLPDGTKTLVITGGKIDLRETINLSTFTKTLPSGSYSVLVTKDDTSYIAMVRVGRFLSSTKVNATELGVETGRNFVGDEPRSCPILTGDLLASYSCSGTVQTLVYHTPATTKLPTLTSIIPTVDNVSNQEYEVGTSGLEVIEDTVFIDGVTYVLLQTPLDSPAHLLFKLTNANGRVTLEYVDTIDELTGGKDYTIKKIGNDLVFISSLKILRGPNFDNLKEISLSNKILSQLHDGESIDVDNQNRILITAQIFKSGSDDQAGLPAGSKITIYDKKLRSRKFSKQLSKAAFCGDYICTISNETLSVLDSNFKDKYSLPGIKDYVIEGNNIYAFTDRRVYQINAGSLTGKIIFSSSYLTINGLHISDGKLVLSVKSANKNHALVLTDSADKPDKLFGPFFGSTFVDTVSIYNKIAFITPNLGEPVIDEQTQGFGYRASSKEAARKSINELIDKTGVESKGYTIITNLL